MRGGLFAGLVGPCEPDAVDVPVVDAGALFGGVGAVCADGDFGDVECVDE